LSNFYEINTAVGFCSCIKEKYESFFKHRTAVFNCYQDKMPNLPAISPESRYLIPKLAFSNALMQ